ncbi:hypothetical protein GGI12_002462 [Dipsacomyces acuminosporus]|nr:hypothetical protein GGI12_002462 [Dipsacomyces acuminosporus]
MEGTEQRPVTYIAIHERTPEMRILYISSSVRQALLYEPEEFVGRSPTEFIADNVDGEEYQRHNGTYSDDNVIMAKVVANRKDGSAVFVRSIAFACSNVNFCMATTCPDINIERQRKRMSIRKFKCNLNEANGRNGEHVLFNALNGSQHKSDSSGRGGSYDTSETLRREMYRNVIDAIKKARQACIVLEDLNCNSANGSRGARIMFVTDSINRILNVDSCDLQGVPFLSLVALEDVVKAADFLDKALHGSVLSLEKLRILENPLEDDQLYSPKCVSVEFMAMGSVDGAIMLCQLERPSGAGGNDGYLSLEEIISSDPGTSDFL